jgi:RNA polymerase sigma factor (TIGR02999 family)
MTNGHSDTDILSLLEKAGGGDAAALQEIFPLVYGELRRIASSCLRNAGPDQTMLTTDLVHESFLKLIGGKAPTWQNRVHFFNIAATAMRQILVDHARARHAGKRGGRQRRVPLDTGIAVADESMDDIAAIDDALKDLERVDQRSSKIVELRFFAGLTNDEIAELLAISSRTVKRDWEFARAWLFKKLNEGVVS